MDDHTFIRNHTISTPPLTPFFDPYRQRPPIEFGDDWAAPLALLLVILLTAWMLR